MVTFITFLRWVSGRDIYAVGIELPYPAPHDLAPYREVRLGNELPVEEPETPEVLEVRVLAALRIEHRAAEGRDPVFARLIHLGCDDFERLAPELHGLHHVAADPERDDRRIDVGEDPRVVGHAIVGFAKPPVPAHEGFVSREFFL